MSGGLLALLQQSATSLQAQQAYSSTVAHNLSNSNTAGYSRQRADIAAVVPAERYSNAFIGRGAVLQSVSQARDRFLEAQIPGAIAREKFSQTEAQTLQSMSALDLDNSVAPALAAFYTQLRGLAQNPGSSNYREAAIGAATQLALSFNRSAQSLDAARSGIDAKIDARIPEINEIAQQIATLNAQIRQARVAGAEPNDLLDARQRLGDRMAETLGTTAVPNSDGDLNLTLSDGTSIVAAERAAQFSVLPDVSNSGRYRLYLQKPDGSPRQPLNVSPGGEIGGLLAARDGALKTSQQQLDQLAFDFSGAINAVAQAGVALDGSTGRPLFVTSATATGAAAQLTVNSDIKSNSTLFPAGSTSAPGDADAVQQMIATESQTLSSGTTPAGLLARMTAQFGASTERANTMNEGDKAMLDHLSQMRQSVSGVSVDEELIDMQKAQRAYEAITQVIKTANQMLDSLMAIKST